MQRWSSPDATPPQLRPCVATFGNFDGVHRGHRAVLTALAAEGAERHLPTVAVTFDPHPAEVMHPERAPRIITSAAQRDALLAETGLDGLLAMPFTWDFAQTSAEDYVVDTFVTGLQIAALVVGADTKGYGKGYTGDVELLRELGRRHGFDVVALEDQGEDGRWSSTRVRELLTAGDVAAAAGVLGRPHRVSGTVVHGHHRGRELGYPTANLGPDSAGLVPMDGVYAGWLIRPELPADHPDHRLPAAVSIGTNPTFEGDDTRVVEAYVLDRTDLDLYGEHIDLDLVALGRPTERFDSIEELLVAMAGDVERTRGALGLA